MLLCECQKSTVGSGGATAKAASRSSPRRPLLRGLGCLWSRVGAIAVAIVLEVRLEDWFQHELGCGPDYSIPDRQLSGWNLPPLMIRAFGAHGQ